VIPPSPAEPATLTPTAPPPSGAQWTVTSGGHEAVVVEVGGGLRTYRVDGRDMVDGFDADEMCPGCAGQILAPWPNRIRDGAYTFAGATQQVAITEPARSAALHGLVNWVRWSRTDDGSAPDTAVVELDLPPQLGYPWPLHLRTVWRIGPAGLSAAHEVTNSGAAPCPFGFSVHPYLMVPGTPVDRLLLHLPARSRLLVDARLLPIGAAAVAGSEFDFTEPRRLSGAVLDTAFGDVIRDADGGSAAILSTVDGEGVRLWADPAFGWWQVFTGDTLLGERFRRSVAVEPMTCPPDAFRSGRDLIVLEPGQTWRGTWGIAPLG
jgi:aldose 1-epimerase